MNLPIIHCFDWSDVRREMFPRAVREFVDNGTRKFVFTIELVNRVLKDDPDFENVMKKVCRDMDVEFISMHSPCGLYYDIDIPDPEQRKAMIEYHIRGMELAKRFGSKTYTMHIGAYYHCSKHMPVPELRSLAIQTLEQLVPHAERIGIIIAVENSFEPPNSAAEVLRIITPFLSSPSIGVCYDSGHANCMASAPGKKQEDYPEYFRNSWWHDGIIFEDNALALLQPHIVTCHLHDNNGLSDLHAMPGDGTIQWDQLISALKKCPRMLEWQSEVNCKGGDNWAGHSPAPVGGYSIRRLTETFRRLGFEG